MSSTHQSNSLRWSTLGHAGLERTGGRGLGRHQAAWTAPSPRAHPDTLPRVAPGPSASGRTSYLLTLIANFKRNLTHS